MANPQNPYGDFLKMFTDTRSFDMNKFFSIYRKNIEAFSDANRALAEGFQTIARRQAEISRASVEQMLKTSRELMTLGSPETNATRQAEFAKNMLQQTLTNVREISDMASKSSLEAFNILQKRAVEGFEEIGAKAA